MCRTKPHDNNQGTVRSRLFADARYTQIVDWGHEKRHSPFRRPDENNDKMSNIKNYIASDTELFSGFLSIRRIHNFAPGYAGTIHSRRLATIASQQNCPWSKFSIPLRLTNTKKTVTEGNICFQSVTIKAIPGKYIEPNATHTQGLNDVMRCIGCTVRMCAPQIGQSAQSGVSVVGFQLRQNTRPEAIALVNES